MDKTKEKKRVELNKTQINKKREIIKPLTLETKITKSPVRLWCVGMKKLFLDLN